MRCDALRRRSAVFAAIIGIVVACGWVFGFAGGALFPIAIGAATAVAVLSDTRINCSPRLLRRRD
jgi:purine-cytosine permease-like protein